MRIALIHALKHSIVPIETSFARLWPDARGLRERRVREAAFVRASRRTYGEGERVDL